MGQLSRRFAASLREVTANPDTWPPLVVILGLYTPYLSFASSWGIPFLRHTFGLDNAIAANYLLLYSLGSIGWLTDISFWVAFVVSALFVAMAVWAALRARETYCRNTAAANPDLAAQAAQ